MPGYHILAQSGTSLSHGWVPNVCHMQGQEIPQGSSKHEIKAAFEYLGNQSSSSCTFFFQNELFQDHSWRYLLCHSTRLMSLSAEPKPKYACLLVIVDYCGARPTSVHKSQLWKWSTLSGPAYEGITVSPTYFRNAVSHVVEPVVGTMRRKLTRCLNQAPTKMFVVVKMQTELYSNCRDVYTTHRSASRMIFHLASLTLGRNHVSTTF